MAKRTTQDTVVHTQTQNTFEHHTKTLSVEIPDVSPVKRRASSVSTTSDDSGTNAAPRLALRRGRPSSVSSGGSRLTGTASYTTRSVNNNLSLSINEMFICLSASVRRKMF